jgi:transcriptional regulator with XRE-family HTH domain
MGSNIKSVNNSIISKNIKKYRNKLGVSQDRLSKMADVTYNTIIKIESGANKNPTIDTLTKIAKALKVGVDDLIK